MQVAWLRSVACMLDALTTYAPPGMATTAAAAAAPTLARVLLTPDGPLPDGSVPSQRWYLTPSGQV